MTQTGLAPSARLHKNPRDVLESALGESVCELFNHYGLENIEKVAAPTQIPEQASIGARIQFANRNVSVGLTLLATPGVLDATHPARPTHGTITSADLRTWALELCNQLSGALRGKLVRYGISAQPGLPQAAYNYDTRRHNEVEESVHAFAAADHGELYIKMASWIDATLMMSEAPQGSHSLLPGQLRLF